MQQSLEALLTQLSAVGLHPPDALLSDKAGDTPVSPPGQADSEAITQIVQLFEQTQKDNERLAEDLLNCYQQLNGSFSATRVVAGCQTVHEAVEALTREIGQAVASQYSYYRGPLPGGATAGWCTDDGAGVFCAHEDRSDDFLACHQDAILELINSKCDCTVAMIEYKGDYDIDLEGRGNVLIVPLTAADLAHERPGYFIFVRGNDHDCFAAIDMNLASALSKMGAAVLESIVYAERLSEAYLQTVASLVRAIEAKDAYTCGHSTRVASFARQLGEELGLGEEELHWLEWAGLLHDIGKIGINDQIICKPGRLTDEEFDQIRSHPTKSYTVLEPIEALRPALAAVKHHHERYDGSGYPDGLTGSDTPLAARILQIADIYDALTSTRSYRGALTVEKAIAIMREEAGSVLDPDLFVRFDAMVQEGRLEGTASASTDEDE